MNQKYVNQAITITGGRRNIYDIQIKNNAQADSYLNGASKALNLEAPYLLYNVYRAISYDVLYCCVALTGTKR